MCMRCADLRSSLSFEVATVDCCAKAGIARSRARTREKSFAGRDILHLQVREEISVENNNVRGLTKIQQGYTDTELPLLLCLFPGLAPWAFLSRPFGAGFAPETNQVLHAPNRS